MMTEQDRDAPAPAYMTLQTTAMMTTPALMLAQMVEGLLNGSDLFKDMSGKERAAVLRFMADRAEAA